ncbi:MAG TPA: choice-of-anchor J domain-containing protein, partial [Flavobacteriaceae bacterium]|nr:choice-of-anchor J domain-containing protein [Flavobacteriaceae bacterium]
MNEILRAFNLLEIVKLKTITMMSFSKLVKKSGLGIGFILFTMILAPQTWAQEFNEDFENGIPNDWGLFQDGEATQNWEATTDGYESNGAVVLDPKLDNIGEGNSGSYFLVTPNVEIPEDAQLRFWSKYDQLGDENTTYKIMISTAPQPDIEDFIDLNSWTGEDIEDEQVYNMRVIDLPTGISPGIEIYIAFVVENTQPTADVSGAAWTVDDVNLISACPLVDTDEVSVDEITVSSATIYWTHPLATDFEIQIVEEGEDIDEEAGEPVNTQMFAAGNLEEDTSYDVYLKSICPNDNEGVWQYVINFQTDKYGMSCDAPIEIGDSYSFEGNINEFPNSADINFDSPGSNCLGDEVTDNYINGNQIYFSYTAQEDGMINISQMTLPFTPGTGCFGNPQSAVFVYDGCDAVGEECLVALRTTNVDQIENINNFPVEAGQTYIIVISTIHEAPDSSVCFEFNLDFLTCPSPTEISYESLLQNSVVFSWDNPLGLGDEWEYAVVPEGQGEPAGSGTVTSENQDIFIDGLDGNTTYDFYVRSICGTDPSQWSQPYTFSTQCEVYDLPYFSPVGNGDPEADIECWTEINANEDSTKWLFEFNYARFPINSSFEGENDDYLVTPQVDLSGDATKQIRFDYDAYGAPVTVSIKASSTGVGADDFDQTILEETVFDETGWDTFFERIVVIPDEISGVVNIAFHIGSTDPSATAFYVKNVNIEEMPACPAPLDPWVDEVSATTADIGWTTGYQETQWEVFVGAISDPTPEEEDSGILVDSNEYTLEDLDPGTQYKYYVRAYCNEEDQSVWVGPVTFNTTCNTVGLEVPYEESFNDSDPDTRKFCWTILNESGNEMIAFQMLEESVLMQTPLFGPPSSFDEWLISPAIELEDGIYDIQFDYRAIGSPFNPNGYGGLEVLMSTTDLDPESFTEIEPLFSFTNSNYQTKSIFHQQEGVETVYIAIRVPPTASVSSLEIDDFKIDLLTECPAPSDLAVDNVTANTADISWEAGFQEDEWDLVVQPAETGLPPADMEEVSQSSLTVQDLNPLTDYEVYVRAKCGEPTGNSEWVGPVNFTTHCDAVYDTPFIETFEE